LASVLLQQTLEDEAVAQPQQQPATQSPPPAIVEEPNWFRGDAHALLRRVYTDPRWPMDIRVDAAKSAIRFERPALVATHVQHSTVPSRAVLSSLSTQQLRALLVEMDDVIEGQADEADTPRGE
jgi:hypothetical protein